MIQKRHIVLAVMVLALGTAVYINWRFAGDAVRAGTDVSSGTGVLGETRYVNASLAPESATESTPTESASDDYFIQAELSRQKARDEAQDTIADLLEKAAGGDGTVLQKAVDLAAKLATCTEQENKIESLLKAKGFDPCLAFLSDGKANILLKSNGLLATETVTVKDIVKTQCGLPFADIIIVEVQ